MKRIEAVVIVAHLVDAGETEEEAETGVVAEMEEEETVDKSEMMIAA